MSDPIHPTPPTTQSVHGDFGCVHIGVLVKVQRMSYRNARKYLKEVWFTKSEQDELIHVAKEFTAGLKEQAAEGGGRRR